MLPLIKHTIQVSIIDDSKSEQCDGHCGVDWSSPEAMTLANQRIRDSFGDKVQLEYLDLSQPLANRHALELFPGIRSKELSLPLLLIDGKLRIAGQFDIRLLLDAINTELELKHE
jgi:disulfide oxidoreductase YuzD